MSDEELVAKFKDCAQYSLKPLDEKTVDDIKEKILHLEHIENMTDISKMLA